MRHLREDSNFAPRPDLPPDLPTDKIKKKPFLFTWRQVVIFIILFILMLAGITIVESVVKTQRLRLQKQRVAEAVCITHGLNRTDEELANCVENSLALSALLEAGMSLKETVFALVEAGVSPEDAVAALFVTTGLSAGEIRKIVTAGVSDPRAAEASQRSAVGQQVALCESRGEHYRYREGACQLRVWVCTESQTSTGYEKECKYEWRNA